MKKILVGVVATLGVMLIMGAAGRSQNGTALTYNLNGSHKFVGSASGASGEAETKLTDGANIMIWCADAGEFINGRSGSTNADGGNIVGRMIPCAAGEKYPLGLLRPGNPYVTIGGMNARFYEAE